MPRQIDLFPGNLQIGHNPLNQLGMTAAQFEGFLAALPEEILQAFIKAVWQILDEIDKLTGLDLVAFADAIKQVLNIQRDLLTGLLEQLPLIGPILEALTGTTPSGEFGAALSAFIQLLRDILAVLGPIIGLGTGSPVIGAIEHIPILGPLIEAITVELGGVVDGVPGMRTVLQEVQGTVNNMVSLIEGVGGTVIGDVINLINLIQQIIDNLANALGFAGTGHTVANLNTYFQEFPGANIVGALNSAVTLGGNAISTLFNSGGLIASEISGALNPAVTLLVGSSNVALSTLLQNLSTTGTFAASALTGALNTAVTISGNAVSSLFNSSGVLASKLTGALNPAVTFLVGASNVALSTLLGNINATGQFAASALTGALNTAVTFSGTALSTLLQYLNSSGQFNAAQLTGALNTALTFSGTALSTLLANLNSSGQFAASALTGALNPAVTFLVGASNVALSTLLANISATGTFAASAVSGALSAATLAVGSITGLATGIGTWLASSGALPSAVTLAGSQLTGALNTAVTISGNALSALFNTSGVLASALTGAINTAVTVAGQTIGTVQSNAQGMIDTVVQAGLNDATQVNKVLSDAKTQLVNLISSASQQLQGLTGNFAVADFISALGAHKTNTTSTQNQVTSVASALNTVASPSGTNVTVDFTTKANQSNMSGVMSPGTGAMGITSGQAVLETSNTSDFEVFPTQATSDYVVIEVTMGSLFDLASGSTTMHIIGRCNSTRDTYVALAIGYNTFNGIALSLFSQVGASSQTFIDHVYVNSISTDGVLKIIMGDRLAGNPYVFEVLYNNSVIIGPLTDTSHFSQIGSGQRYVGLQMQSTTSGKFPPGIKKVHYYDNAPSAGDRPYAQLPANNSQTPGGLYIPSDTGLILRDNGTSWDRVAAGPLGALTAPPTTGWTAVNQGSAAFAADKDAMLFTAPSVASSESFHMWVRTLSPSSGYAATFYLERLGLPTSTWFTSIVLRNSTSGSLITFDFGVDVPDASAGLGDNTSTYMGVQKRTSPSAFSAAYKMVGGRWLNGGMPNWMRIRDDGANRYFEYSHNGVDWMTFFSVGRTDFITPDQIGVGGFNLASGQPVTMRVRSLSGVS